MRGGGAVKGTRAIKVIRREADTLRRSLKLGMPVDLEKICQHHHLQVEHYPLEPDVAGLLVIGPKRSAIGLNKDHPATLQRMALARAIGHFILHPQAGTACRATDEPGFGEFVDRTGHRISLNQMPMAPNPLDVQAHRFAQELLMPVKEIEWLIRRNEQDYLTEELPPAWAKHFGVSRAALCLRLNQLGLLPEWGML